MMEICERGEIWIEKDDDLVFDHTKIILREKDDIYSYAKIDQRLSESAEVDLSGLHSIRIPTEHVSPLFDPSFTRAPEPLPPSSYLKRPKLLYYEEGDDDPEYACHVLTEVKACEALKAHPHVNIAQYRGCVVNNERISGLVFANYPRTLAQVLRDGLSFDRDICLQGIEAGLRHMHMLGLIHNDLNPSNIMMDGDSPVIIDFDSCQREGSPLGSKTGTDGWTLDGQTQARRTNDLYSLSRIRAVLTDVTE